MRLTENLGFEFNLYALPELPSFLPFFKKIRIMEKGEHTLAYDSKRPVNFIDVIDKETEPSASRILRILNPKIQNSYSSNAIFPNVSKDVSVGIRHAIGREVDSIEISVSEPRITVLSPIWPISNVSIFRNNPDLKDWVDVKITGASKSAYKKAAGIAREYYIGEIRKNGFGSVIDWKCDIFFPSTYLFTVLSKVSLDTRSAVGNEIEDIDTQLAQLLGVFRSLGCYKQDKDRESVMLHRRLHDTGKGGLQAACSDMLSEYINSAPKKFRAHIALAMQEYGARREREALQSDAATAMPANTR